MRKTWKFFQFCLLIVRCCIMGHVVGAFKSIGKPGRLAYMWDGFVLTHVCLVSVDVFPHWLKTGNFVIQEVLWSAKDEKTK